MESPPPPTKWLVPIGQSTATNIEFTGVLALTGGRGGIRTHGTLAGTPVFKTGALNHSATLPVQEFQSLSVGEFRTQRELGPTLDPKDLRTSKNHQQSPQVSSTRIHRPVWSAS